MRTKGAVKIFSWALFDLAIKFFTLNMISLHFVRWLTLEKGVKDLYYSLAFGCSMVLVAFLAPYSGRIFDKTGMRKRMFIFFTVIAALLTTALGGIESVVPALLFFALANLFLQIAIVIYNALISEVAPISRMGLVSGVGKMFGFAGAIGVLFLMNPVVRTYGYHAVFFSSGILLLLFSLPCMLFIRGRTEEEKKTPLSADLLATTFRTILVSFGGMIRIPGVKDLLKACFYTFCSLNALMLFMAVYLGKVFGMEEQGTVNIIASATAAAILGSVFFGMASDRIGYKKGIYIASILLIGGFFMAGTVVRPEHILLAGIIFGLAYGGVMSVSRPLAVSLVPEGRVGELFGFIALAGYAAAVAGPLFWGGLIFVLRPVGVIRYRIVVTMLSVFLFPALYHFRRIPDRRA
jgi:UMF1 family MFS transporter